MQLMFLIALIRALIFLIALLMHNLSTNVVAEGGEICMLVPLCNFTKLSLTVDVK